MATFTIFNWTAQPNGSTVVFNSATDQFVFDDPAISAASVVAGINGASVVFTFGGKSVGLFMNGQAITTTNITFANGSQLIVGDNTTDPANDDLNNVLVGGAGNDHLRGRDGDDNLTGGLGNDLLNGGDSNQDFAIYIGASGSVNVNLTTGVATGADGTDTLVGIEYVSGSHFNDIITGDNHRNFLIGNRGDDIINGGGESDLVLGNTGSIQAGDYVDYRNATVTGVTVNLATGIASGADGNDSISNIESVRGSNQADIITGNAGTNFLRGGLGNDTLDGGGGIDIVDYRNASGSVSVNLATKTVSGADGVDTINNFEGIQGGDSGDTLIGDANDNWFFPRGGNDTIDGGGGFDFVSFRSSAGVTANLGAGQATGEGTDTLTSIEGIEGSDSNDTLTGKNLENNILRGFFGNDTLRQTTGAQTGADILDGGGDSDTLEIRTQETGVDYTQPGAGVEVNLAAHTSDLNRATAGAGEVSTLISIETVRGTPGDDILIGGDPAHHTDSTGSRPGETFRGNAGNDIITGAEGDFSTTADYANNTNLQPVTINLSSVQVMVNATPVAANSANDGLGGSDTLSNIDGLRGGSGDDILVGGSLSRGQTGTFFESYRGNAGNDVFHGNNAQSDGQDTSNDRADYANSTASIIVNLSAAPVVVNAVTVQPGTVNDGQGGTDTLIEMDQTYGGAGNDNFTGSTGNDTFDGGSGADILNGGSGSDEARFQQSTDAVVVNLSATTLFANGFAVLSNTAYDGMGFIDTLISMENVRGSDFNDYIRGSDDINVRQFLAGDAGSDTIDGGAGIDFASYNGNPIALGGLIAFLENGSGTVNDKMGGIDTLINIEGIRGTNANDILTGGAGDQWFQGRAGNDTITGGSNSDLGDTVSYNGDPAGVTVNLANGTATDGWNGPTGLLAMGGTDTLIGIENVEGSAFDDTITGKDNEANILAGRGGNDTLNGGGGTGIDFVTYRFAGNSVNINLGTGQATGEGTDTLVGIEGAEGSPFNDTILGNGGNNVLIGNGGDDSLDGAGGVDIVSYRFATGSVVVNLSILVAQNTGSQGTDTLSGFEGIEGSELNDTLTGSNATADLLLGRGGNDLLRVTQGADTLDGGADSDTIDFSQTGVAYGDATGVTVDLTAHTSDLNNNSTGGGEVSTLTSIETVFGTAGNDVFVGGDPAHGPDALGNSISERFLPGAGNDSVTGSPIVGVNTIVDYSGNSNVQSVNANLATGVVTDGLGGTDTLVNVGQIRGGAGNDTLVGGGTAKSIQGNFLESFRGGPGNDILNGGDAATGNNGTDRADYTNNTNLQPIIVNLGATPITVNSVTVAAGTASDGMGGTDTLIDIQQVFGGAGNDTIQGGAAGDTFDGGIGNDSLNGGAGNDEARFQNSTAGVIVNLSAASIIANGVLVAAGTANDGMGGVDTLVSMENVRGSDFNDYFRGSDGAQRERFDGDGGSDFIDGGAGVEDFASYQGTASPLGGVEAFIQNGSGTVFDPLGGTDTLVNIEGLVGTNTDDALAGGAGTQWFEGRGGDDAISGGADADWVTYAGSPGGVNVNLVTNLAHDGWEAEPALNLGGIDELSGIENVEGSPFNDTIAGAAGVNVLNGGGGFDTLDYSAAPARVIVNLLGSSTVTFGGETVQPGTATDGFGTIDTISSFEKVVGSAFADFLQGGSNVANVLDGGAGNDTLVGSGTGDTTPGPVLDDTLLGGLGDDVLRQTRGHDVINGGDGSDRLEFNSGVAYGGAIGVSVNLATGLSDADPGNGDAVNGPGGDVATLTSIETAVGTAGNDVFLGGDISHAPGAENGVTETFRPLGGNDTITGWGGHGWITNVDYSTNTNAQAVVVTLGNGNNTGTANDGLGGTDTLVNVDQVRGGAGNDTLKGGSYSTSATGTFSERFRGNAGNDTIDGWGSDTTIGTTGIDTVDYNNSPFAVVVNLGTNAISGNFYNAGTITVNGGTARDGFSATGGDTDTLLHIDVVSGSAFNDTLVGSDSTDTERFEGRDGNDFIDGRGGNDEVDYGNAPMGVTVNLALSTVADGYGTTDTLVNIEWARGGDFNDTLIGGNAALVRLIGGLGNDTINGGTGTGIRYASFASSGFAANASVANGSGTASDGQGGTDTLININGLWGSSYNDTLTGGAGDQWFRGRAGNDTINGGADIDTVSYSGDPMGVTVNLATGTATDGWGGIFQNGSGSLVLSTSGEATTLTKVYDPANPIVGSWELHDAGGSAFLTFLSNGTFLFAEDGIADATGHTGMERGTFTWNQMTGEFHATVTVDTNGEWGVSHSTVQNLQLAGDRLTGTDSDGTFTFSKVGGAGVVGGWFVTDAGQSQSTGAIAFLSDGTYLMAEDGSSVLDPSGQDGMERGTYTWNPATRAFTYNTLVDTSGEWGLSHSGVNSVTVNGSTDTLLNIENVDGSAFGDTITGNSGANLLNGGGGNDTINGGDGVDTAKYSGTRAQYTIALQSGVYTVTDTRGGAPDGVDTVSNVEFFQFSNETIAAPGPAEIAVSGKNAEIADGDATPSSGDDTDFGTVVRLSVVDHVFTVTNSGNFALSTASLTVPTGFSIVEGLSASIAPSASDTFTVRLDTATTGTKSGQITFTNNDGDESPFNFSITGVVTDPEIAVSGNAQNIADGDTTPAGADHTEFGSAIEGHAGIERTFTVANTGDAALTTSGLTVPAGFSIVEGLSATIAASGSDTFTVRLNTTTVGVKGGQISFTNNDSNENPFNFSITGTVTANHPPVAAPTAATQSVSAGQGVAASTLFSASDVDGANDITQYQFFDTVAGGGRFQVNGVDKPALQVFSVNAADLATVTYQGANIGPSSELLGVRAFDGLAFSGWANWTMNTLRVGNVLPVVNGPASKTFERGQAARLSSFLSVTDADGDPMVSFEVHDNNSTAGSTRIFANGVLQAQGFNGVANSSSLNDIWVLTGSENGTDTIEIRANDGFGFGNVKSIDIVTSGPNRKPVATPTAATQSVSAGQGVAASTLFGGTDPDGNNTITQYQFFDTAAGGGRFQVNGVDKPALQVFSVNAADLATVTYQGGDSAGSETLGVRAFDGLAFSDWANWTMNTLRVGNVLPVVNGPASKTFERGQAARLSSFLSVTDADGDPMVSFEVHDNNSTAGSTRIFANGVLQAQGFNGVANSSSLNDIWVLTGSENGTDTIEIRANDGFGFGNVKSIDIVTSGPNRKPVATPTAATQSVSAGQGVAASTLFGGTDPDGNNTITQYQFFDTAAGGGRFQVNGVDKPALQVFSVNAADLATVTYQGGDSAGSETLGVRAFDGLAFSDWANWTMNTLRVGNVLPVVNGPASKTFERGQAARLSSFLSVTDADGDPMVSFEVHDNNSTAGSTRIFANGVLQAQGFNGVANSSSLNDIWVLTGSENGTDTIEIRANDGFGFGNVKSIDIVTSGPNRAPVVTPTAATQNVSANQTKAFSLMLNATDADGDPITFQLFDTGAGGGHIEVNGEIKADRTLVTVNNLDNVVYRGANTAPSSEVLGVRASDGLAFSEWKNWQMNTLAA